MANTRLFGSTTPGKTLPPTDTLNQAGGKAYSMAPEHALAQFASTGCFNQTFYAKPEDQLKDVLALCDKVSPKFVAQVAVYMRENGRMKDMPALLCAYLASKGELVLLSQIFPKVCNNGKMIRNFVQIIRSGTLGRKSLGTRPKKLIQEWFNSQDTDQLFYASVGNDPSLADVIKLSHPTPGTKTREALFSYILDKEYNPKNLPAKVKEYEEFKKSKNPAKLDVPDVNWELLTALDLTEKQWVTIAQNMTWTQVRMNLNTLARHGVFKDKKMVQLIADRIRDEDAIKKVRPFPYQLLAAFMNVEASLPVELKNALQDAMEFAVSNVPVYDGKIWVFPDVSGSMGQAVTGSRGSATSVIRCVDVAALIAAVFMRNNPNTGVIAFDTRVHAENELNGRDSIMTNAQKLARYGGGGTDCSLPLKHLNQMKATGDLVYYASDNESWADVGYGRGTGLLAEWEIFKKRNPDAKLVCHDLVPNRTTQANNRPDILNIGGFSDEVFNVVQEFANGRFGTDHWTNAIKKVRLA